MITPNGIRYTWGQIFDRLGVKSKKGAFFISQNKVKFHYSQTETAERDQENFHLIIVPGDPKGINLICDDQGYMVRFLSKADFLPQNSFNFPVNEMPFLFWGKSSTQNEFAEIIDGRTLVIKADLILSIFFLLSRYEEFHLKTTDKHGRFPYSGSAASRYHFIELPLVDLYAQLLKTWLEELTGTEIPQNGKFEIALSHDVDFLSPYRPAANWLKTFGKDALRMKPSYLIEDIRGLGIDYSGDPYFLGFKTLAEVSASHGLTSVFNLMSAQHSSWDEGYSMNSKEFNQVVKVIQDHGHQIGLHASYRSFDHPELVLQEKVQLEDAIKAEVSTVRQHYLRVRTPQSWEIFNNAHFTVDTSYGFSDHEGFRCGTCRPYRVFDLLNNCEMELIEEPLIVMDTTMKTHKKLSVDESIGQITQLARICRAVNGKFTLLWHNTSFFRDWQDWGQYYPRIVANLMETAKG